VLTCSSSPDVPPVHPRHRGTVYRTRLRQPRRVAPPADLRAQITREHCVAGVHDTFAVGCVYGCLCPTLHRCFAARRRYLAAAGRQHRHSFLVYKSTARFTTHPTASISCTRTRVASMPDEREAHRAPLARKSAYNSRLPATNLGTRNFLFRSQS
jgi:hypothetical protein